MTSLIFATFGCWLDKDNHAIATKSEDNYAPFLNIWHTIQPSSGVRGAVLDPELVGIVYCMILKGVFQQPTWPGHIHVDIGQKFRSKTRRPLGKLDIATFPTKGTWDLGSRNKNESLAILQQDPVFNILTWLANTTVDYIPRVPREERIDEKVWLELLTSIMLWAFTNQWQVRLNANLNAGLYSFPSAIDGTKWFSLVITEDGVDARASCRWYELVEGLIELLIETVQENQWRTFYWLPMRWYQGKVFAWISLGDRLGPLVPGPFSTKLESVR